jgi:predicted MFS family arabinose efflux permease
MDRRLLVLALGMFALGTDSFVVAGVLPEISKTFHITIGAAGQMTTAYAITYALLSPLIAAVAAHIPRKTMLLTGLGIFVVANLITAEAPGFAIAIASRVFAGVGAAMFAPTSTGAAASIVPAERRGFALSIVIAGLTAATALGTPIGAAIGALGDWRWTMVFVAALAAMSAIGVGLLLKNVPLPPNISFSQRIKPAGDPRVALTLLTTWLYQSGQFVAYTYLTVVFDRAIGQKHAMVAVLLVAFGLAGTLCNLVVGRLADSMGNRRLIFGMLIVLALVLTSLSWASSTLWLAIPALIIWGAVGWGLLAPQQHRLVAVAPQTAPVVLGLNTSFTYFGITTAGVLGALAIPVLGPHNLGYLGAGIVLVAFGVAELATWRINQSNAAHPTTNLASA